MNFLTLFAVIAVGITPLIRKEVKTKGAYIPFRIQRPYYPTTNVVIRWETPNHELPFVSRFEVVSSTNLLAPIGEWGIEAIIETSTPKSVSPAKSGAMTSHYEVQLPVVGRDRYFLVIPQ